MNYVFDEKLSLDSMSSQAQSINSNRLICWIRTKEFFFTWTLAYPDSLMKTDKAIKNQLTADNWKIVESQTKVFYSVKLVIRNSRLDHKKERWRTD